MNVLGDCVLGKTLGPAEALHIFLHFKRCLAGAFPFGCLYWGTIYGRRRGSLISLATASLRRLSSLTRLREAPRVLEFVQYDHNMFSSTDIDPSVDCPNGC